MNAMGVVSPPPRRTFAVSALAIVAAVGLGVAQAPQAQGEVRLLPVQGNVSMIVGAGANITVQAGDDGILLVDTGVAALSEKVLDTIWPLSSSSRARCMMKL